MTEADIRELDAHAVRTTVEIVEGLGTGDLSRPTPCADWTLADLLVHMTVQQRGFAAAAAGDGADPEVWRPRSPAADPVADYREAAEAVIAAFGADGTLERPFALHEFGPEAVFPGRQAMGFHLVDNMVHGWDVAAALGVPYRTDPEAVQEALRIARMVPDDDNRLTPKAAFAPGLPVPADADPLTEMLTRLGRSPDWTAER